MVYEVVDNAIDEALAGHCDRVLITLNADGSVSVEDNGRGIPTGHPQGRRRVGGRGHHDPAPCRREIRQFDQNAYKVSGGLHGVGVSSSTRCPTGSSLSVWRDGKEHFMRFRHGVAEAPLKKVGETDKRGHGDTSCRARHVQDIEFDFDRLEHRLRELAFLNSGRPASS
jgi:DNA gyrase subunit B